MAHLSNLNGVADTLPAISKLPRFQKPKIRHRTICFSGNEDGVDVQEQNKLVFNTTRRATLSLGSIALVVINWNGVSSAEDNGFWIDGPLPIPPVYNKIGNEKTGKRSFVRPGIYIADVGTKGRMRRLRRYAFDLIAMADLIGPDTLNYVRKYLRLKGTFMYYDFDKVISAAVGDDKQSLNDLANRLFDNFEKLEESSRLKNFQQTEANYADTTVLLQEVMTRMMNA